MIEVSQDREDVNVHRLFNYWNPGGFLRCQVRDLPDTILVEICNRYVIHAESVRVGTLVRKFLVESEGISEDRILSHYDSLYRFTTHYVEYLPELFPLLYQEMKRRKPEEQLIGFTDSQMMSHDINWLMFKYKRILRKQKMDAGIPMKEE